MAGVHFLTIAGLIIGSSYFHLECRAMVKQTGQLREFKTLALIFKTEREISYRICKQEYFTFTHFVFNVLIFVVLWIYKEI